MAICLKEYGRGKAIQSAEAKIKETLKSPRSYHRYSGSSTISDPKDDGTYKVEITLEYGAANSFGGEVTDTATVRSWFKIDLETCSVIITKTELSAYDNYKRYS